MRSNLRRYCLYLLDNYITYDINNSEFHDNLYTTFKELKNVEYNISDSDVSFIKECGEYLYYLILHNFDKRIDMLDEYIKKSRNLKIEKINEN